MATQVQTSTAKLTPYRFTVRQFERMIDAGVFEDASVELLAGVVVPMTTNERHNFAVGAFGDLLFPVVPAGCHLRLQLSGRTARFWRPEPDVAIVRGARRDFTQQTPNLNRFAFLIEVSDTSFQKDRTWKWRRYAASGVPVYGILDLNASKLHLFTSPAGRGRSARYEAEATCGADDQVPVVVDGREITRFRLGDVLP
jgi:Uma2 family endonuclease